MYVLIGSEMSQNVCCNFQTKINEGGNEGERERQRGGPQGKHVKNSVSFAIYLHFLKKSNVKENLFS